MTRRYFFFSRLIIIIIIIITAGKKIRLDYYSLLYCNTT
jgi:hypothetical protein